jgi:hypothetical protein
MVRRRVTAPNQPSDGQWRALDPEIAARSSDARLQIHHAAQLVAAVGISYLPKQGDDSHTNLEWVAPTDALACRPLPGDVAFRLAVRPHPFALLALHGDQVAARLPLDGVTIENAAVWARRQLAAADADPARYTLAKHYTIPAHPVADGAPFRTEDDQTFDQIGRWFAGAAQILGAFAAQTPAASEVRCWPHHFDIATLVAIAPGKTIGLGMEPGDVYYDEPYYYVNLTPGPSPTATLRPLSGGGRWHTKEWTGAVLVASHLEDARQREQIETFIASAVAACTKLLSSVV